MISPEASHRQALHHPPSWMSHSDALRASAAVLWQKLEPALNDDSDEASALIPQYMGPYLLLAGYAVETALKALVIRIRERNKTTRPESIVPFTHSLIPLAEEAGVPLTSAEQELLPRLQQYMVWGGRYPAPTQAKDFVDDRRYLMNSDHDRVSALLEKIDQRYQALH